MENMIEVRNMGKHFPNFALKNISFDVKKGFITGIIGPNGAGKSTMIRCMMDLIRADSGEITIFGRNHRQSTVAIKGRIGFVHDESYFYEHLSIEQHKRIIAPFYENWSDELFYDYIHKFHLPLHAEVKRLSKGMKIKFSLAIAFSHNPELLILDEPTSGLDPVFRRELLELLQDFIQDENKAVFFSTHITTDLEKVADYITFIHNGEIVFSKEKDALLDQYAVVKGPKELLTAKTRSLLTGVKETDVGFAGLCLDCGSFPNLWKQQVAIERATLEDIIFYTVKEDEHANQSLA
ncbi:ABC transporter ATP-binding protein [Lentibacillus sp. N15]|uniref:ABC transporter ATP-binding protein n=1 Tax=Lentibacillus songyuanensis TaxID=3136161 RepID=UPI0031B9E5E2